MGKPGSTNTRLALEDLIYIFYALAVLSAIAIAAPITMAEILSAARDRGDFAWRCDLGDRRYIAYAGGKIRHREFRNEPAPPKNPKHEHD